jgi:hypothetical protein
VIIRSSIRGGGAALASYLLTKGNNLSVQVFDIKGTCHPDNLRKSLVEMSLTSELSGRTTKGLYHVVICPRPGEDRMMTHEQWIRAAELVEQARGFTGQKRVMVMHENETGLHCHVAWERYNHETGKMICNKHSHRQEMKARRIMEREFGHQLTDEKNKERPALRLLLADLWQQQPTGRAFQEAVTKAGYTLAIQKHRRPYVIVNGQGRSFELIKEIPGVRTRQVRQRLKDLSLPDKVQVIDAINERRASRRKTKFREQLAEELQQQLKRDTQKLKGRGR